MQATAKTTITAPLTAADETGLIQTLREIPRGAWILFIGIFVNKFGTFVIPFLALYLRKRGYTLADAGMAIGAYGLGTVVACFLGGYLADRIGRRKTIAISMFCAAGTMLLLSRANSLLTILLITGLNALAAELYRPASSALLTDLVPPQQRVMAFAAYRLAFNAGWAFGPATAGFWAEHSFSWLFVGDATTSLLFGLFAWFALPHGVRSTRQESSWGPALRHMKQDRAFLQLLLASLVIAPTFFQLSSTYGLHVTSLGFSTAVYGALISFNGFLVVCLELPLTTYTRRFPTKRCIALGYLLIGSGFGVNVFASTLPWMAAAMAIITLGEMFAMPIASGYVANLAPADMRGRYMGALGCTWSIALVFGPGSGMYLFSIHPALLWSVCAVCGIIAAALITRPVRD
jgi:MFS family permease